MLGAEVTFSPSSCKPRKMAGYRPISHLSFNQPEIRSLMPDECASCAKPSGILCLNYSTSSNSDNLYVCANGINDAKYAYNNLQGYHLTWYQKFDAKWHMGTETWCMYENNVPNVAANVANPVKTELDANGAFCAVGRLRCTAPEYAIVNYLNRDVTSKFMIRFRLGINFFSGWT